MHNELGEDGTPLVRVAAVPEEQTREVAEFGEGEVRGERRLTTFFAFHTLKTEKINRIFF